MKQSVKVETQPAIELTDYPVYPPVALKLWEAREWLSDESHWSKGKLGSREDERTCALGALTIVGGCDPILVDGINIGWRWETSGAADALLNSLGYDSTGVPPIAFYNDAPTTTHADILALFDRAIDLALKEGK